MVGMLGDKVKELRGLSDQINIHIKEDNSLLDGLDTSFDATGSQLGGTMKKLSSISASASRSPMCTLACFVFVVIIFMWWVTK